MKNGAKLNSLQRGERITVVEDWFEGRDPPRVVQGRVRHNWGRKIQYRVEVVRAGLVGPPNRYERIVKRRDEGKTWVRGWDTPEANAMQAAYAIVR